MPERGMGVVKQSERNPALTWAMAHVEESDNGTRWTPGEPAPALRGPGGGIVTVNLFTVPRKRYVRIAATGAG